MNCENIKELMVVNIFGKLSLPEKKEMDNHIKNCSKCALISEKIKIHNTLPCDQKPPHPDWHKSWDVIAGKSFKKKFIFNYSHQKYALAVAVLIVVFVTGFLFGRKYFLTSSNLPLTISDKNYEISIHSYTEDLEPILIDFLNRSEHLIPAQIAEFEKNIVKDMLIKTKLLKYLVSKRENSHLEKLFEDIEFILLSLSNLRPEDYSSMKQIQQFIRDKNIKYQLKLFADNKLTI